MARPTVQFPAERILLCTRAGESELPLEHAPMPGCRRQSVCTKLLYIGGAENGAAAGRLGIWRGL